MEDKHELKNDLTGTLFSNVRDKEGSCLLSLSDWIEEIKSEKWKSQIEKIRTLQSNQQFDEARMLKQSLPAFVANAQCLRGRTLDKVDGTNALVMADYDRHDHEWARKMHQVVYPYLCVAAVYTTPSGGLRVYVLTYSNELLTYKKRRKEVLKWLDRIVGCESDPACSNVIRLSFASHDEHAQCRAVSELVPFEPGKPVPTELGAVIEPVPDAVQCTVTEPELAPVAEPFEQSPTMTLCGPGEIIHKALPVDENGVRDVEAFLEILSMYFPLEQGQRHNHLICIGQYAGAMQFTGLEMERLIDAIYKRIGCAEFTPVTIGKPLWWGYDNHTKLNSRTLHMPTIGVQNPAGIETPEFQDAYKKIDFFISPHFPKKLYENLPPFFAPFFEGIESPRDLDKLFLSLITVLSFAMPNVKVNLRAESYSCNLYTIIVGPPGSGKSIVQGPTHLLDCIILKFHREYLKKKKEYKIQLDVWQEEINLASIKHRRRNNRLRPTLEEPHEYLPFQTSNISKSMLLKTLKECIQGAMLFSTELDNLTIANMADCGNWLSELRSIYQNEMVGYSYKYENGSVIVPFPKLTLLYTATENQLVKLIPDMADGFYSRCCIYSYEDIPEYKTWANDDESRGKVMKENYKKGAEEVLQMYEYLEKNPTEIYMPEELKAETDRYMICYDGMVKAEGELELLAVVHRAPIVLMRMCGILAAMRKFREQLTDETIYITREEFDLCLPVVLSLIQHSCHTSSILRGRSLTGQEKRNRLRGIQLYNLLKDTFTTADAIEMGKTIGMCQSKVYTTLKMLLQVCLIEKKDRGVYRKINQKLMS